MQRLQLRSTSAFATFFDPYLVSLALILSTLLRFLRYFRTVSKGKEKVLFQKSTVSKSFLNRGFDTLKMIGVIPKLLFFLFFSNTQILPSAHGYLFYCSSLLSRFSFELNPYSENLFLILRNTGPIIDFI